MSGQRIWKCCLLLLTTLLTGCNSKPGLLLYCGAGIRPPVAEIADEFSDRHGVRVDCDYAGSEVLLSRIKLTNQGDLYMPGDMHYVEMAEKEGLVDASESVCYFIPAIMVQKDNPKNIQSLADLANPGIRLGLGDAKACAIGRKTSKIFAKNDIDEAALKVTYRAMTVNDLANHVKLGTLDAVIVWDAIAKGYPDDGDVVPIPVAKNIISTVPIAVLSSTTDPEMAAKFVDFVTSGDGRAIFKKHRYTTELPEETPTEDANPEESSPEKADPEETPTE